MRDPPGANAARGPNRRASLPWGDRRSWRWGESTSRRGRGGHEYWAAVPTANWSGPVPNRTSIRTGSRPGGSHLPSGRPPEILRPSAAHCVLVVNNALPEVHSPGCCETDLPATRFVVGAVPVLSSRACGSGFGGRRRGFSRGRSTRTGLPRSSDRGLRHTRPRSVRSRRRRSTRIQPMRDTTRCLLHGTRRLPGARHPGLPAPRDNARAGRLAIRRPEGISQRNPVVRSTLCGLCQSRGVRLG